MKKVVCLLAVLAMTAPMFADVTITAVDEGDGVVAISYASDGVLPRAFGLDITVDAGTIDAVSDVSPIFWVFMGTIVIEDGAITDNGSPVAPSDDPGALGGIGTDGITIEMGSLYEAGVDDAPAAEGLLLKVQVSDSAELCVALNGVRGGIVLEDVTEATAIVDCIDVIKGDPVCPEWAHPCHSLGDVNADGFIDALDVGILVPAWGGYDCRADLNHDGFLDALDVGILVGAWGSSCP